MKFLEELQFIITLPLQQNTTTRKSGTVNSGYGNPWGSWSEEHWSASCGIQKHSRLQTLASGLITTHSFTATER